MTHSANSLGFLGKLSIIIITYNSEEFIQDCLDSINFHSHPQVEIIIFDNASSDNTVELIKTNNIPIKLYESKENLGFAKGVNSAVTHATGDLYCLINPDLRISLVSCLRLAQTLNALPSAGIIGPRIIGKRREMKIVSAGHFPTVRRVFSHFAGISRMGKRFRSLEGHYFLENQVSNLRETDWITGACLLIARDTWLKIGGFSTHWFMYGEDIDLCYKAKLNNHKVYIDPTVTAEHYVGGSSKGSRRELNASWILNLYDFYLRTYKPGIFRKFWWKFFVGIGLVARSFYYGLRSLIDKKYRKEWISEAVKFSFYASEILRGKSSKEYGN